MSTILFMFQQSRNNCWYLHKLKYSLNVTLTSLYWQCIMCSIGYIKEKCYEIRKYWADKHPDEERDIDD